MKIAIILLLLLAFIFIGTWAVDGLIKIAKEIMGTDEKSVERNEKLARRPLVQAELDKLAEGLQEVDHGVYLTRYHQFNNLFRGSAIPYLMWNFPVCHVSLYGGTAGKWEPMTEEQFAEWKKTGIAPSRTE